MPPTIAMVENLCGHVCSIGCGREGKSTSNDCRTRTKDPSREPPQATESNILGGGQCSGNHVDQCAIATLQLPGAKQNLYHMDPPGEV